MAGPLQRLESAVTNLVSRAVVKLINDEAKIQIMQLEVLKGELRTAERFQQYGLTCHPHPDAEAVVVFPGGMREHGLILAVDDRRYRLKALEQGEVALYTDQGDYVHLMRDGTIKLHASTEIILDAPLVTITGDLQVDGTATATTDVVGGGIHLKTHVHSGVQSGPSNTGAPVP